MPLLRAAFVLVMTACVVVMTPVGQAQTPTVQDGSFERDVAPVITYVCMHCHNEIAGVPIERYRDAASIESLRENWEQMAQKIRAHEMPASDPDVEPLGDEDRTAMLAFLDAEFERIDASTPIDPGRVTARRLNRSEYQNTVRDLLGIDFDAASALLADDTGYGFDNIGDVLTVSPVLMQQYMAAAERIAARAVGDDPLPTPGVFSQRNRLRRQGASVLELTEILSYDADYLLRVQLAGNRGDDDPPVTLVISVDGTPVKTVSVPVQITAVNKQGGATNRVVHEVRMPLSANAHTFRAEFVNDEVLKTIPENMRRNTQRNIFPEFIDIEGPFAPAQPLTVEKKILVCDPATGPACVHRILGSLARRAYRRPVTPAEVSGLVRLFDRANDLGYSPKQSLQFAVTAVLVSPQFLFRMEADPPPNTVARISDVELASRLSYFLWSSMPDDELLDLAEAGRLHQPEVLEAQVRRMLADPKSAALADNFASQWLETRSLDAITRDPELFPEWGAELREAMRTETRLFFDAMLREERPLSDFIDGRFTFLNERLARHYGIQGIEGPEFRRVTLETPQRSGVFTQASVLTVSSYPTRTSVVLRGKFLLENLFNAPPPPPPADVPAIDEAAVGVAKSLRVQMEAHRTEPICASCHVRMDPLGFALENYDAVGRWRTTDGAFPVDASGAFPNGRAFDGPAELKNILMDSVPEFTKGLSERMLTYALGRGVEAYDRPAVRAIARETAAGGDHLTAMIQAIVRSAPFQMRRGERSATQEARRQ